LRPMARRPDSSLPPCSVHPGSTVRREGTYGKRQRPRLRCFYVDVDGTRRKHGFTPPVPRQLEAARRVRSKY